MNQNQHIFFSIEIAYDQYLQVYQGKAVSISVMADDGRRVAFPAGNIQNFLTKDGINGDFEMQLTAENRFISIKKLNLS